MMAVLAMCAHLVFAATDARSRIEIRKVSSVAIDCSVQAPCQSATVTLPRNIRAFNNGRLQELIRRGDPVQVSLGYNGDLQLEFDGFVESISADVPVVIKLRDRLWTALQRPFNKAYANAFLPAVVRDLVGPEFKVEAMEASIGPIRFEQTTVARALKTLKDDYGMVSYLKGDTVYCGVLYAAQAPVVKYRMELNVKSSDLKFRTAEDVKMRVVATSVQAKGKKKLKVEVGDPEGERKSIPFYGITSEAELRKLALASLDKFKYSGYQGSFTGYGSPLCRFGDKVDLSSTLYPERDGQYLAEAVKVEFSDAPSFERNVTLAQRWI